ncbi:16S rRNA (guanine(966)-N(2))-methyltransferase RsmD [Candidatus Providencia siddallii]|uniref:Ribosomal RNA small subunit methyltransferase D n=1 Tax=Candidatus Providencia siddallii TaxID=1715285 RepID=A0ABP1CFZ5_9GAMM
MNLYPKKYNKKLKIVSYKQIKIISGKWRGRKLFFRSYNNLRPTRNKIKETLFNWLNPFIQNSNCLDCFAGTGSLGFEALSRFAKSVTFIELNKNNINFLLKNKKQLQADNITIINKDILTITNEIKNIFDIIFIDPPFYKGLIYKSIQFLEKKQFLSNKSLIYIESESNLILVNVPINWELRHEKISGQVAYRLFYRKQNIK